MQWTTVISEAFKFTIEHSTEHQTGKKNDNIKYIHVYNDDNIFLGTLVTLVISCNVIKQKITTYLYSALITTLLHKIKL